MDETHRDEADAAEDVLERESGDLGDAAIPEADALEQAAEVRAPAEDQPEEVGDRPEADALEQARGVSDDDEEERR